MGKLTVNEYYFIKHRTDGSKVLNGLIKLDVVGRGAQVGSQFYFINLPKGDLGPRHQFENQTQ